MAGGKVSPRQKMINMMYLVLTALLALNVTKEILLAFTVIDNSLSKSTANIDAKTVKMVKQLSKIASDNDAAKAALVYTRDANKVTKSFVDNIHEIKTHLLRYSQGAQDPNDKNIKPEAGFNVPEENKKDYKFFNKYPWVETKAGEMPELVSGDNLDDHVRYFNEENGGKRGKDLEKAINQARVDLLGLLKKAQNDTNLGKNKETRIFLKGKMNELARKTSLVAGLVKDPFSNKSEKLTDKEGKSLHWAEVYFHSTPLAAVFAILSKVENDAKLLESEVCQALAESVSAADFKFDAIIPVVAAKTGAVVTGQTYEADILLAAYNSKADMKVFVNGSSVPVEAGVGKYKLTPQSPGTNTLDVKISVPKPGGGEEIKVGKAEFTAFAPSAAISADALAVFYVGLENPVSISVGGIDPSNYLVRIVNEKGGPTRARIIGSKGRYKVQIKKRTDARVKIQVAVRLPDGRVKSMGEKVFKVNRVPDPRFQCGGVEFKGAVNVNALKLQKAATAVLKGFVYEGVRFKVTGYKFMAVGRRTNGPRFATSRSASLAPIKGVLGLLGSGDLMSFSDITAVGPDGTQRLLDNASAIVK
ncbi:MAG: GldM family protein [Bacteroidia bacterium]